ncbi:MAG: hypothetical protein P8L78_12295 [Mariniblastus sp.]|nr:hypothetical protein [Mariniblastus sp.]
MSEIQHSPTRIQNQPMPAAMDCHTMDCHNNGAVTGSQIRLPR